MIKFRNRFLNTLVEQDDDKSAMISTLDSGTDPSDFDVPATPPANSQNVAVSQAISQRNEQMTAQIRGWVTQMDQFLEYLNGTEDSVQTALAAAEADTILDRMRTSEQRKIARVATEIASLAESFKGYLSQTNNSQFKYV